MKTRSMISHLAMVAAAISIWLPCQAQTASEKIDSDLKKCLAQKSNATTAGMRSCVGTAYEQMDHRLNEVYSACLAKCSAKQKEDLKDAQRKWLAFRDAEIKLRKSTDPNAGGTLALVTGDNEAYEILKRRTKDLEILLKILS